MPPVIPRLKHVATSACTTYEFRCAPPEIGWANCTVNDGTGELLICSDWGSWSHRWDPHPESLGYPTITAFLGRPDCLDYVARKLQREGRAGRVFSSEATAKGLRKLLVRRRLAHGREQLENRLEPDEMRDGRPFPCFSDSYTDDGLPILSHEYVDAPSWDDPKRKERLPYLTNETARRIWDDLAGDLSELGSNSDLFYDRVFRIDGFTDYVTNEPWQHEISEQTMEDRALREIVLPALIAVCSVVTTANTSRSTP